MDRISLEIFKKYDAIIFDLGGVILDIDLLAGAKAFAKYCGKDPKSLLDSVVRSEFYLDYEKGKISTKDFRSGMCHLLGIKISDSDFDEAWGKILLTFPKKRIERLIELKKMNKRLFLLSNTNPLHQEQFEGMLRALGFKKAFYDLLDYPYYSHKMGLRKPDQEIYKSVIAKERLVPSQTLFVDDLYENITAAESVGLVGFHLK